MNKAFQLYGFGVYFSLSGCELQFCRELFSFSYVNNDFSGGQFRRSRFCIRSVKNFGYFAFSFLMYKFDKRSVGKISAGLNCTTAIPQVTFIYTKAQTVSVPPYQAAYISVSERQTVVPVFDIIIVFYVAVFFRKRKDPSLFTVLIIY